MTATKNCSKVLEKYKSFSLLYPAISQSRIVWIWGFLAWWQQPPYYTCVLIEQFEIRYSFMTFDVFNPCLKFKHSNSVSTQTINLADIFTFSGFFMFSGKLKPSVVCKQTKCWQVGLVSLLPLLSHLWVSLKGKIFAFRGWFAFVWNRLKVFFRNQCRKPCNLTSKALRAFSRFQ